MTEQQQQVQQPSQPVQPAQQQPAQPVQPAQPRPQQQQQQVPVNLLANQVSMIEDYQAAAAQNTPMPQPQIVQDYATDKYGVYHPDDSVASDANNAYQAIIEQQQAQIRALIAQTNAQSQQITRMVQGGAQFMQQPQQVQPMQQQQPQQFPNYYQPTNPMQQFNPPALSDNQDWSLEALGKEIGKPRKE